MSFLERLFINNSEKAQSIFSDVKFIIFAFGLISSLGFLTIYSFLYGYYFGGLEGGTSNFSIISNLIPFSLQTLSMISIFFICIYYTISRLFSLFKKEENKWLLIIVTLGSIIILNICITIFFANDITFTTIISFSLIWLFVGVLVWYLYLSLNMQENIISMVKGMFSSIFLLVLLLPIFLNSSLLKNQLQEIFVISTIPLILLFTTIFHRLYQLKWIAFISYFPFFFLFFGIILYIFDVYFYSIPTIISYLLVLILPSISNGLTYKYLHGIEMQYINNEKDKLKANKAKGKETQNSSNINKDTKEEKITDSSNNGGLLYKTIILFYEMFTSKKHIGYKVISCLLLLAVFVWTPRIALFSGGLIRILNIPYGNQIEITYVNQNGVESSIKGNYYIEHNSTLYISNCDWELEIIKPLNYHVKTMEVENFTSQK